MPHEESTTPDPPAPRAKHEEKTLAVEWVATERVHLNPANPRRNDPAVPHVAASLRRFGWQQPLVARPSGEIVAGNTRLKAAKSLGLATVPVIWFEGSDLEATAYSIADNRTHEFASWDGPELGKLLDELRAEDGLESVGFTADDIDRLLAELVEENGENQFSGEDEVPEPPAEASARSGDLWVLGRHRLLVGDSASAGDLDRLLAGQSIQLLNTDPPYNVNVEPRSNNAIAAGRRSSSGHHQSFDLARHPRKLRPTHRKLRAKDRPLANDFVSEEAFARLLERWFGNAARALEPGRSFYIWGGYANCANYPQALKRAGLYFSQALIWVKEHPVLTRKDFMGNHEWCFYGWREGAAHRFFGPANVPDVWSVKKVNPQSMVHLTEKPVELARRAILYSSRKGEAVLDLFAGSGSTLIAAEETGRRAYLMELDPLYADIIIARWERFTGREAALDESGKSFRELARERGRSEP